VGIDDWFSLPPGAARGKRRMTPHLVRELAARQSAFALRNEPAPRLGEPRRSQLLAIDDEARPLRAALALAERHPGAIHLLLTDVVMPGLSGPEAAARFLAVRPEARVLYMSGYAGDPIGRRGLLPAGAPLLLKPFTEASLLRMVREVLADVPEGG
jgi:CheY-like chemotaxis protein